MPAKMEKSQEDGMTLTIVTNNKKMGLTSTSKRKERLAVDVSYHEIYKEQKDPAWLRERMVKYALEEGIRASARHFNCSRNTIRLWLRRKDKDKNTRFKNESKRPHKIANKTDPKIEQYVLDCHENERMGGRNLKHQYNIPKSESTVNRILKRNGKTNQHKRKHRESKDLRELKARQKCFETVQVDGKKLSDIHNYYPYYTRYLLPLWQFTLTCEKSGASFYAYCRSETSIAGCAFLVYVLEHLKRYGINVKRIKTDKGSFAVARRSLNHTAFQKLVKSIYKMEHKQIVHKNQNADVERFHGLVEQYFYDICHIGSKANFYRQAIDKQVWFNFIRKNGSKNWQTPLEILKKDYPNVDPQVLALRPIYLDKHTDIYLYKIDPDHKPLTFENFFKDVPDEDLISIKNYNLVGQDVMRLAAHIKR